VIGVIGFETIYEYSVLSAGVSELNEMISGKIGIVNDCIRTAPFAFVAVSEYEVPTSSTTVGVPISWTVPLLNAESERPVGNEDATIEVMGLPDAKNVAALNITFL
jgi:hypothetical protein